MGKFSVSRGPLNGPLVSVVMPVRNMERFLGESIESIRAQSFRDFELIVLDFGSTDKSKAIVSSHTALDSRIRLHEVRGHDLAEARNAGCSVAQGRYIAVQDADDISLPDRLMMEVDFMESHPEIGLLGGLPEWMDSTGNKLFVPSFPTDEQEIKSALPIYFPFCHSSLLIRMEVFHSVGGYRPVMTQAHDYDLVLRISELFRCASLPQVVVKYRVHGRQVSVSKRRQQSLCKLAAQACAAARRAGTPDPLKDVEEVTPAVLESLGITETQLRSELVSGYQNYIRLMIHAGEPAIAMGIAKEALRSRWQHVDRFQVGELYYSAAWHCLKENRFAKIRAAFLTILACPQMTMRFVMALFRRLKLA
jgi:hypothetical protein